MANDKKTCLYCQHCSSTRTKGDFICWCRIKKLDVKPGDTCPAHKGY